MTKSSKSKPARKTKPKTSRSSSSGSKRASGSRRKKTTRKTKSKPAANANPSPTRSSPSPAVLDLIVPRPGEGSTIADPAESSGSGTANIPRIDSTWIPPAIHPSDLAALELAAERVGRGESLTTRERTIVERVAREYRAAWRCHVLKTIPISATGWQFVQRRRAADSYGLRSLVDSFLDLDAFFAELRGFLADNQAKLTRPDAVDPDIRRERRANADLAELKVKQFLGHWVQREDVRRAFDRIAGRIARLSESLHRDFGRKARDCIDAAVRDLEFIFESEFGGKGASK